MRNNQFYKSTLFYRAFQGMNPSLDLSKQLVFNSSFESGNLDCVIKIKQNQFDLFLRIDTNTRGHLQWFYFSVSNGSKQGQVQFNIVNISKSRSLHQFGMLPYVFSQKDNSLFGRTWQQRGNFLSFNKTNFRYTQLNKKYMPHFDLHTYSFEFNFQNQNDTVYFSYCIPYTFSRLLFDIKNLPHTTQGYLGRSLLGIEIPLLLITNHDIPETLKKNILITGRMHPSETNGSHTLHGFLKYLTSNKAQQLRKIANFWIVPIVNPDGVVLGNTRTGASGKDINRQYVDPDHQLFPEATLVKNLATKLAYKYGLFAYLDFHGHSRRKNTFIYGPAYTISDSEYYLCRLFPKLVEKNNPGFRYFACSFGLESQKKRTARGVIFQELKVKYTWTIQTSIGCYFDSKSSKTINFTEKQWIKMGQDIGNALNEFVCMMDRSQKIAQERALSRKAKRKYFNGQPQLYRDEEDSDLFVPQTQILKISYQESLLFAKLYEQVRNQQHNTSLKQYQMENNKEGFSSDDQNEAEDLEISKLQQLNLIIKQKNIRKFQEKSGINNQLTLKIAQNCGNQTRNILIKSEKSNRSPLLLPNNANYRPPKSSHFQRISTRFQLMNNHNNHPITDIQKFSSLVQITSTQKKINGAHQYFSKEQKSTDEMVFQARSQIGKNGYPLNHRNTRLINKQKPLNISQSSSPEQKIDTKFKPNFSHFQDFKINLDYQKKSASQKIGLILIKSQRTKQKLKKRQKSLIQSTRQSQPYLVQDSPPIYEGNTQRFSSSAEIAGLNDINTSLMVKFKQKYQRNVTRLATKTNKVKCRQVFEDNIPRSAPSDHSALQISKFV